MSRPILVMLNIIRSSPMPALCVDVESHKAWFSVAKFLHITIMRLAFHVLVVPASFICCGVRHFREGHHLA
eukprot:4655076-Prorocentrum_lima.AAC.1